MFILFIGIYYYKNKLLNGDNLLGKSLPRRVMKVQFFVLMLAIQGMSRVKSHGLKIYGSSMIASQEIGKGFMGAPTGLLSNRLVTDLIIFSAIQLPVRPVSEAGIIRTIDNDSTPRLSGI